MRALVLLLILASCGDDGFKKVEKLEGFRILGMHTATPEVSPGATVSDLRIFFSDPEGGGRQITGTTVSCIDPGISLGAPVTCEYDPTRVTGSFTIDTTSAGNSFFTGMTSNSMTPFTVPSTIFLRRTTTEQFNGVGYIIIFQATVDGKEVKAFRRIAATNRGSLNTNPSGSEILLNGSPIAAAPGKDQILSLRSTSQESYDHIILDGSVERRTEKFQVAWYESKGEINKPKSFVDEDVKYLDDQVTGPFLQMAIVRDERGGIEFIVKGF